MRLWSLHPRYLDVKGLVACWREGLLAKKCLEGLTKGYKNHPQLSRFKSSKVPIQYINKYLSSLILEASKRGYKFNQSKIQLDNQEIPKLKVTFGQIAYEWQHLLNKLEKRDLSKLSEVKDCTCIEPHPLFEIKPGEIEFWEKI